MEIRSVTPPIRAGFGALSGQVSWLMFITNDAFPCIAHSGIPVIRSHLQWRDRAGISPASLLRNRYLRIHPDTFVYMFSTISHYTR